MRLDKGDRGEGGEQRQRSARRRRPAECLVAAASRSSTATPPVPSSCAAIMRSASPGPRRMRNKPSATITSTKPAAPKENQPCGSLTPKARARTGPPRLPAARHRLLDVEAVDNDAAIAIRADRKRARQQAGDRAERVARQARRETRRTDDEPGLNGSRGSSARRATSNPARTDWCRKRNAQPDQCGGCRRS